MLNFQSIGIFFVLIEAHQDSASKMQTLGEKSLEENLQFLLYPGKGKQTHDKSDLKFLKVVSFPTEPLTITLWLHPSGPRLMPQRAHPPNPGLCRMELGLLCGIVSKAPQGSGHTGDYKYPSPRTPPCQFQWGQLWKGCRVWLFVTLPRCVRALADVGNCGAQRLL